MGACSKLIDSKYMHPAERDVFFLVVSVPNSSEVKRYLNFKSYVFRHVLYCNTDTDTFQPDLYLSDNRNKVTNCSIQYTVKFRK